MDGQAVQDRRTAHAVTRLRTADSSATSHRLEEGSSSTGEGEEDSWELDLGSDHGGTSWAGGGGGSGGSGGSWGGAGWSGARGGSAKHQGQLVIWMRKRDATHAALEAELAAAEDGAADLRRCQQMIVKYRNGTTDEAAAAEEAAEEMLVVLAVGATEVKERDPETPVTPAEPAAEVAAALRHEESDPAWMVIGEE